MSKRQLVMDTPIVQTTDHVASEMGGGETILMSMEQGIYFRMNEFGATIWKHTNSPISAEAIAEHVQAEYEVDKEKCGSDVLAYLQLLYDEGLLKVADDSPAS